MSTLFFSLKETFWIFSKMLYICSESF